MTRRWEIAVVGACLAVFGVIQAIYVCSGVDTYRDIARGRGQVTFVTADATLTTDESGLADLHRRTLAYVLGDAPAPPAIREGLPLFDANERAHLADVRAVFGAVRVGWGLAALVGAAVLIRARLGRRALLTLRAAAILAGLLVLAVGLVFAVAFEPAFLLFHEVFFPQGNFLFDPRTSNLLRLYPEPYWYGVILRIAVAVVGGVAVVAAAATIAHRAARRAVTLSQP